MGNHRRYAVAALLALATVAAEPEWAEQFSWLIDVVFGFAVLTLLGILTYLARKAVARHDANQTRFMAEAPPPPYTE